MAERGASVGAPANDTASATAGRAVGTALTGADGHAHGDASSTHRRNGHSGAGSGAIGVEESKQGAHHKPLSPSHTPRSMRRGSSFKDSTPGSLLQAPPTHFPPLLADNQPHGGADGAGAGAGEGSGSGGDSDDSDRSDSPDPMSRSYFNLTSVLADPRRPDRPPLLEDVLYGDAPFQVPAPPTSLPVVSLSDFVPFFDKIHTQNAGHERAASATLSSEVVNSAHAHRQCYDKVPAEFFNPTFALNAPEAFERYLCVPASLAQQNKLSNYLDLVEVDLLQTIGERSDDFFHALSTFQELQNVVTMAVNDIGHLRERVRRIKQELASRALQMLARQRRYLAMKQVHAKAKLISGIPKARELVVRMVLSKDYGGALAVVDKTLHVLSTELRGIKCVEQIKEELHRYRRLIADTLTQSFRDTAVGLVIVGHHGSDDAGPAVTENGSSPGGWGEVEAARFGRQLDAFIRPQLAGLLRVNGLLGAVSHYRVKLKAEVKNTVRSVVNQTIECLANPADDNMAQTERTVSTALLRGLSSVDFARVLSVLMDSLCALCLRANALHELIQSTLDVSGRQPSADGTTSARSSVMTALRSDLLKHRRLLFLLQAPSSPVLECPVWAKRDVLQAARSGNQSAASLLVSELWQWCRETDRLPPLAVWLGSLPDLSPAERGFVERLLSTKAASGEVEPAGGGATTDVVASTRKNSSEVVALVSDVAQKHVEKILKTRREVNKRLHVGDLKELWDCVHSFSDRMDGISHKPVFNLRNEMLYQARDALRTLHHGHKASLGTFLDREDWRPCEINAVFQCIADILSGAKPPGSLRGTIASARTTGGTPRRELNVHGQPYSSSFAALKLLEMLEKYISSAAQMPAVSATVVELVVDLLRQFNSRTDQLLLQAHARKLQTLRTITAKHLAIASQCLGLVVELLPSVRASLMVGLPPSQHILLDDFTVVTKDFKTHIDRIMNKLVGLVRSSATARLKGIESIAWDEPGPTPSGAAENLIKDVSTLHKVLAPRLRPEQTREVFSRIASMLSEVLPTLISKVPIHTLTKTGKERLSADVRHIILQLRGLRALRNPASSITASLAGGSFNGAGGEVPGSVVRGRAAIHSLEEWLNRVFGGTKPPPPPTRAATRAGESGVDSEAAAADVSGDAAMSDQDADAPHGVHEGGAAVADTDVDERKDTNGDDGAGGAVAVDDGRTQPLVSTDTALAVDGDATGGVGSGDVALFSPARATGGRDSAPDATVVEDANTSQ